MQQEMKGAAAPGGLCGCLLLQKGGGRGQGPHRNCPVLGKFGFSVEKGTVEICGDFLFSKNETLFNVKSKRIRGGGKLSQNVINICARQNNAS